VRDPSKFLPSQVGSPHPLPKTYAQVVQGTCHVDSCRTTPSLGAPQPARKPSLMADRRRKMLFINSPNMAVFLKGSVPADIFLSGRPALSSKTHTTKLKLKQCLKSPVVTPQKLLAYSVSGNLSNMSSLVVATPPSQQGNQYVEFPWQSVRGKYWWRKGKLKSSYSAPNNPTLASNNFPA
jgi:hypothetical protein